MSRSEIRAALIAVPLAATAMPADAQNLTARIEHADLDLESRTGMALLKQRLDTAIAGLCGPRAGLSIRDQMEVRRCYDEARRQANEQVGALTKSPIELVIGERIRNRG